MNGMVFAFTGGGTLAMATTRNVITRGPGSTTWPKTDPAAIAPVTFRPVDHKGLRWTVRVERVGDRITGTVAAVELASRRNDPELPSITDRDKDEVVAIALDRL